MAGKPIAPEETALALLRSAIQDPKATFRDGQWEAIDALVNRRERVLVVQRTGWGKSAVYFLATALLRRAGHGPTIIVSPLLALMRNQIEAAQRLGVTVSSINSDNSHDWDLITTTLLNDKVDALLVSPERLANEGFVSHVLERIAARIGLLVIDEAHCISDWGHDFRPDYRRLSALVARLPSGAPVLATTATANDRVVKDVSEQLGAMTVSRGPLARESLALDTIVLEGKAARLAWLAEHLPSLPGSGVVYVLTKDDAELVAAWLTARGVAAAPYMGGGTLDADVRVEAEQRLLHNKLKVLVATSALGMGFDKPDLSFVVHFQAPGSVVAYYQQVGRAGRAIPNAFGLLMAGAEDADIHDFFRRSAFPSAGEIDAILEALEEAEDGLTQRQLESVVNVRPTRLAHALKWLSTERPAPVVKEEKAWKRTPVRYQRDGARLSKLTSQREDEWKDVQRYVSHSGCLMAFLQRALDDDSHVACGKCSRCLGRPIVSHAIDRTLLSAAQEFQGRRATLIEPRQRIPKDSLQRLSFGGTSIPAELRHEEGRVLSQWADGGWGDEVMNGKRLGAFSDELVSAAAMLLQERWKPTPGPAWVTCVPSLRDPELVPNFARRLAMRLSLPFHQIVRKVRQNEPQKRQENSFHQVRNLDGVFEIVSPVPGGPVLLVDDVVDSRWTLTIVGMQLRSAGAGPVLPLALASAKGQD